MLNVVYCVSLVWESLFILCSNIKANKVIAEQSLKAALKKKVCLTEFVSFKKHEMSQVDYMIMKIIHRERCNFSNQPYFNY